VNYFIIYKNSAFTASLVRSVVRVAHDYVVTVPYSVDTADGNNELLYEEQLQLRSASVTSIITS